MKPWGPKGRGLGDTTASPTPSTRAVRRPSEMSERPSEQEKFIQQIAEPGSGGTHAREAARAKLDALLIKDLTASLGQLGGEVLQTRKQMAQPSLAASRHPRALVAWAGVLSFAAIRYAGAAVLP